MSKFSIDSLVGDNSTTDTKSAFVKPSQLSPSSSHNNHEDCDTQKAENGIDRGAKGLSQSWHDVLMPHLQMACTNPFLMGLAALPSTSASAFRPAMAYSDMVQSALQSRAGTIWSQQWLEILQQANGGHQNFFPGTFSLK